MAPASLRDVRLVVSVVKPGSYAFTDPFRPAGAGVRRRFHRLSVS